MALIVPTLPDTVETKIKNFHLGPNNFTLGQDTRMSVLALDSPAPTTMKRDYVRWGSGRADGAIPPAPADILSRDERHFNRHKSETHAEFAGPERTPSATSIDRNKLRATNFKMDSDLKKFNLYDSSHKIDYPPKEGYDRTPAKSLMVSHIPQGDVDKVKQHHSDYMQTFKGHDALANKPQRAHCLHFDPSPSTKGDLRQSGYDTSQKLEFPAKELPFTQPFPHQRGGNIPEGDREKEMTRATTMGDSFKTHNRSDLSLPYDKSEVVATLFKTSFRERDGKDPSRSTTMKENYIPQTSNYEVFKPNVSRNHSDCPPGDDDPYRNKTRANETSNNLVFHGHRDARKPHIVQGSEIFTKSKVSFGDPAQRGDFYETSMKKEFENKKSEYKFKRHDGNTRSVIPLNYYPGPVDGSVYRDAFYDPMSGRQVLDADAEDNLRRSHIRMPLTGEMLFSTEHKDKYTRKGVETYSFNRHHLQRSSLPIGTLNQSIHLDGIKRKATR